MPTTKSDSRERVRPIFCCMMALMAAISARHFFHIGTVPTEMGDELDRLGAGALRGSCRTLYSRASGRNLLRPSKRSAASCRTPSEGNTGVQGDLRDRRPIAGSALRGCGGRWPAGKVTFTPLTTEPRPDVRRSTIARRSSWSGRVGSPGSTSPGQKQLLCALSPGGVDGRATPLTSAGQSSARSTLSYISRRSGTARLRVMGAASRPA